MTLAELSIRRPIFITCLAIVTVALGLLSYRQLGVDMLPNVSFPIVTVTVPYPGAAPAEIETLVCKVLEDEMSTVPGIKSLRSISREGVGTVVADFSLEVDIKYAEQQVRDRVSAAKRKLPKEVLEPAIRKLSPSDQPIMYLAIEGDLPPERLFAIADEQVRPRLEQVNQVGLVEIIGGRKREIHVELDATKLKEYEISSGWVVQRLQQSGQNIPIGKVARGGEESVLRAVGEYSTLDDIAKTTVNFFANDVPVRISDLGQVRDTLSDETARTFVNGKQGLFIFVFKQSGANTLRVSDGVKAKMEMLNGELANLAGQPRLTIVRDTAKFVRFNLDDVKESILLGIILTIIVVYLFLGSFRSTIITGLALPNSLLGAFILMSLAGFTINSMTLLAMSLAVGLLVDDAIVVRENIFRHIEHGMAPRQAALTGTREVSLAVIATTLAVLSVFGPVGYLKGVVGQFFREFALTICFAMLISLYDSLTIAPMLSAYFAGSLEKPKGMLYRMTFGAVLSAFEAMQKWLDRTYAVVIRGAVAWPWMTLLGTGAVVGLSILALSKVPKTFLSPQDFGEFAVGIELDPGANLDATGKIAREIDELIRKEPEIAQATVIVGTREGQANVAEFTYSLVPRALRSVTTTQFKDRVREMLRPYESVHPKVKDVDFVGGGMRPFNVNIIGDDFATLESVARRTFDFLKDHPGLSDIDFSHKPGKPEVRVVVDRDRAARLGVSSSAVGAELRTQVEGSVAGLFRERGREYDIRVRLEPSQRDLAAQFGSRVVPNMNNTLVRLRDVSRLEEVEGPTTINRQDRSRYIQIAGDVAAHGPGLGAVMSDIDRRLKVDEPLPEGMRYVYVGQAESFKELGENILTAFGLAVLFTYLVLASLYESFIVPFAIMIVLPLALCGAFAALYVAGSQVDINSMIGCILLLGLATKNSILLVDYANQCVSRGMDRTAAILEAGKARLRPILMTTAALIAGTLPVAIGLNEASKQRTSMGIAVIGGLISSTLLTLIVIPAVYPFFDRLRVRMGRLGAKVVGGGAGSGREDGHTQADEFVTHETKSDAKGAKAQAS